ncbi:MAG: zinc ABC transporter solute-binding protein [Spirulina sp. SIO3F2]|nr:zinc ABC transporter solute-binding protein [Spirulina sp. SIO3F2]
MLPQQVTLPFLSRSAIALTSAIALGLSSCASSPTTESTAESAADELQVVTTFLPITQLTQAVAGDRADVVQLLPTNVSPHDYQAKPTDVQAIAEADVLVQNGLEFEYFLDDLIENADNDDLVIIDSSEAIETVALADHEDEETDDHAKSGHDHGAEKEHEDHEHEAEAHSEHEDHHDEEKEGTVHSEHEDHEHEAEAHADHEDHHDEEKEGAAHSGHGHHHHGDVDPHIWLDPKRAIEQVENIRDGLIAADPDGEAAYTANAAAFIEELQTLDQEITERLQPYQGQTFISFHDFAAYFAQSYGLNAEFLVDVPEENPTPEDVKRVIKTTKAEDLKALLTEPQGEEVFQALAQDLGVEVVVFDPLETGATDAPEEYLRIMRQNLASLEAAFTD